MSVTCARRSARHKGQARRGGTRAIEASRRACGRGFAIEASRRACGRGFLSPETGVGGGGRGEGDGSAVTAASDLEFVEAEQLCVLADVVRNVRYRVDVAQLLAQLVKALVHIEHELVEVETALGGAGREGRAVVEGVHQHALAAADAAVQVHAARHSCESVERGLGR